MTAIEKIKTRLEQIDHNRAMLIILLSITTGAYYTFVQTIDNKNLTIVFFVIPLAIGLVFVKDAPKLLMIGLVFGLTFSARFRFGNSVFHSGGAEASLAPLDFPLLGLLFLWFLENFKKKRPLRIKLTLLDIAYWLFVFSHVPSFLFAVDKSLVLLEIFRLIKMGLIMGVARHYIQSKDELIYIVRILFLAIITQGLLAISQTQFETSLGLGFLGERDTFFSLSREGLTFGRAGGTLGHSNALANFFELTLPIAVAVYLGQGNRRLRYIAFLALGMGSIGLFFTSSRAGWAALIIGLAIVLLLLLWFQKNSRKRFIKYLLPIIFMMGSLSLIFLERIIQRIQLFSDDSWTFRKGTYVIAQNMFKTHPIVGIGANNYMLLAQDYLDPFMAFLFAESPVHNIILLITAETGLTGIIAFIFLIFVIFNQAFHLMKADQVAISVITIGIIGGLTALLAHAMLDWLFRYDPIFTLFWFQIGLLDAMEQLRIKQSHH